jgi:hypothetical protein
MTRLFALTCALIACMSATVGSAWAARDAPPGNAGEQQYTESLPEAGGTRPTRELAGGGHHGDSGGGGTSAGGEPPASPTEALGAKTAHRFQKAGPDGQAAARLAAAGAATPRKAAGNSGDAEGSSRLGQVVGQLTGTDSSQGMGLLLPLIIVATLALAVGFAVARRRPTRTRS